MTTRGEDDVIREADLSGATVLAVVQKRWDVRISLRLVDGREVTMIASADSYYTDRNNVWWGTQQEWEGTDAD